MSSEEEIKQLMEEGLPAAEKRLVAELGPPDARIEESYYEIPLPDGHRVRSKIWRPRAKATTARPLILFFHGGGFRGGSCEQGTRPGREFALELDAVVVSAEYRLAPEYKFPQAQLDGIAVAEWLAKNAEKEFGADLSAGFIVGGHSAGGQIAGVVASEARSKELAYPITGSFICIATFFVPETVPEKYKDLYKSWYEFGEGLMGRKALQGMLETMDADTKSPLFCPVYNPQGLGGLPPTYLQMGSKDVLRDDGVVYERLLRDAGVSTKMDLYAEIAHGTFSIWTKDDAPGSKALQENTMDAMRWLLKR